MWLSKSELSVFQDLRELGLKPSFEIGTRVGRGFADLGYEEYCILPGNRLQSLLTGTITPLAEHEKEKLFGVFSADDLLAELNLRGFDVTSISSPDQRKWILEMQVGQQSPISVEGKTLLAVCCAAIKLVFK
jgi:hypothetical protein